MSLRDKPYLPLYVQDFLTDEKLRECSASSYGVYITVMCVMHKSEEYGVLTLRDKQKQGDDNIMNFAIKLSKHLPFSVDVIASGLSELVDQGVLTLEGNRLYQKRMVRDAQLSQKRSAAGSAGGRPPKTSKQVVFNGVAEVQQKGGPQGGESGNFGSSDTVFSEDSDVSDNSSVILGPDNFSEKERKQYAENVWLSDDEYNDLLAKIGAEDLPRHIEVLNCYKGSKGIGTDYSDYWALRGWVSERCAQSPPPKVSSAVKKPVKPQDLTPDYSHVTPEEMLKILGGEA